MKKRLLQMFFLCLPLAVLLTVSAGAVVDSGTWGDNITWTLDNDGVLTFSGTGKMADVERNAGAILPKWMNYRDKIQSAKITEGITYIGGYVFGSCNNLTEVTIPTPVSKI